MTILPTLKLKSLVTFPASIRDGVGIDVVKQNGSYQFNLDFGDFAPPTQGISDPPHQNALIWNSLTGSYSLVPVTLFGVGGSVPEAPNDGVQYGRQNVGWTPIASGGGGTPSNTSPLMNSIAAAGPATAYSRGDHVHPSDTSRQAQNSANLTAVAALSFIGLARRTSNTPTWTVGDPLANTELAAMGPFTFKGNNTGGSATPTDTDIAALTTKGSPAGGDYLLLSDQSASGAWKKIAISTLPGASGGIADAPNDHHAVIRGRQSTGWAVVVGGGATPSNALPVINGTASAGVSLLYARGDHVHPTDTSRAAVVSPVFTGDPQAPTASPGDSDNSIATTRFVTAAIAAGGGGVTPAALTRISDTNVTLTLGGTPATAVLQATSITVGWSGTLAPNRGGFGADVSASNGVPVFAAGVAGFDAQLFSNIPQNSQSAAYTTVATDAQKHLLHPTADNNARTYTIPANATVPYPIGTCISFVNLINTLTIAITTDTLTMAGSGSSGSRTLAASGVATAMKIAATQWIISGTGLT